MNITDLFPIAKELDIYLLDGTPTDIKFKVVGQDSKQFRDMGRAFAKSMMTSEEKPEFDRLEKQNAQLTAACIVGWSGLEEDGKPIPYSPEKANELMSMPELAFIREQVEKYVSKRAAFFRKVETSTGEAGKQ